MRKISDLFTRSGDGKSRAREQFAGGTAVMVDYRVTGLARVVDQMAVITEFYAQVDFPRSMPAGNLAHCSGIAQDESLVFTSIWESEATATKYYERVRPRIEQAAATGGAGVEAMRRSSGIYRFAIGEDLAEFSHERATQAPACVGYLIDVPVHGNLAYDLLCEKMRFPSEWPEGLLMHVAGSTDIGWRTFSVWRSARQSRDFLEQRLMPASVDVVRDTGLFPEIRPLEVKPQLFAVNARILG